MHFCVFFFFIFFLFLFLTEFSEEEKKNIMNSDGFKDFFDYSTKIVERALDEPYDFMIDYRIDNTIEE